MPTRKRAIENAAIERLTGELVLTEGRATVSQLRVLSASLVGQEEALASFRENGGEQLWQKAQDISNADRSTAALGNFRSQFAHPTIIDQAPAIDPAAWSGASGQRVASLEQLADFAALAAADRSAMVAAREQRWAVTVVLAVLVVTGAALLLSWLVAARIVRPLQLLTAKATRIGNRLPSLAEDLAGGDSDEVELVETLTVKGRDEVGRLSEAINAMTAMTVQVTREQLALRCSLQDLASRSQHLALHDMLTGLPNRAMFTDRLTDSVRDGVLTGIGPTVLMLDLDGFKEVNDTLGHHCGDLLLVECSRRMSAQLRGDDLVARLGGDEFAVVLPTTRGAKQAEDVAARIAAVIAAPFMLDGQPADVTVSVGIAPWAPGDDPENLLRKADAAMYWAKTSGTGIAVYDDRRESPTERRSLLGDLRRAIVLDDTALRLEFQPIVDLPTGSIVRLEALARWTHPEYGEIPPIEFIPVAERHGLMAPLTDVIAERAITTIAELRRRGRPLPVAINVSASGVNSDLVAMLTNALERHDVPPSLLTVEVTETVMASRGETVIAALQELRDAGVTVAMDDFGAGYSNLSRLGTLPLDVIKLDRSLIADLECGAPATTLVGFAVAIAAEVGMTVIAEGVETVEQERQLLALGCRHGQGYLYSRPVPLEALPGLLTRSLQDVGAG